MDEFNMAMLKRGDADIEEILGSSPHVTMYIMSVDAQKWERGNVEGTLFVLKRKSNPRFQLMVVNKLGTENYKETIESGFHAEVQPPYLIYTQGGGKVHALWFYEEPDLNKVAGLLLKVEAGLPKPPVAPPGPAQAEASDGGNNEEGASFWDVPAKQERVEEAAAAAAAAGRLPAPHRPEAPAPPPVPAPAAAPAPSNAITNLFNKMQIKQQQQQASALSVDSAAAILGGPSSGPVPLPPSFFQGGPQAPPAPAPAPPARPPPLPESWAHQDMPPPAPSAPAPDAAAGNALTKLFNKLPGGAGPAAPPAAPSKLTALFTNAANKQQQGVKPAAAAPATPATPPRPGADTAAGSSSRQGSGGYEDKLRLALSRLVQRDEFISLLSEELRAAGLAP